MKAPEHWWRSAQAAKRGGTRRCISRGFNKFFAYLRPRKWPSQVPFISTLPLWFHRDSLACSDVSAGQGVFDAKTSWA